MRYEWKILEMANAGGVVTQVWFELTAKDGGRSQAIRGSVTVPEPEGEITDYAKLTEKQVVAWLKAHPGADYFKERAAAAMREPEPATAPQNVGLPWAAE